CWSSSWQSTSGGSARTAGSRDRCRGLRVAREELPQDQETFDRVLAEEQAKGTDRRVAEGRARSAAVRAYRAAHGEPSPAPRAGAAPAAAATAAQAEAAPGGDGDGQSAPAPAAAPVPAAVAAAAPAA